MQTRGIVLYQKHKLWKTLILSGADFITHIIW